MLPYGGSARSTDAGMQTRRMSCPNDPYQCGTYNACSDDSTCVTDEGVLYVLVVWRVVAVYALV